MKQLGDTAEKIAVEKCGIIKPNSQVVLYPLNKGSVIDIVKTTAREKNCGFTMPDIKALNILEESIDFTRFEYKGKPYKIKLAGRHQVYNAITVIETANRLFNGDTGIEKTFFPARFEALSKDPVVVFDGAHNIPAVTALKEAIKTLLPGKKIIFICGMLKDKNPEAALKEICAEPFVYKFTAVPVDSPRAETPEKLCGYASKHCQNAGYDHDLHNAVKNAAEEAAAGRNLAVVCFGSLYLAEHIKKYKF